MHAFSFGMVLALFHFGFYFIPSNFFLMQKVHVSKSVEFSSNPASGSPLVANGDITPINVLTNG